MIYLNSLRTPDGTILISQHQHDYVEYTDANGKHYFVDGGPAYCRSSANGDEVFLLVDDTSPHVAIREHLAWGTYGKSGNEPYRKVLLKDMDVDHILAIISDGYENVRSHLIAELKFRGLSYPELDI